MKLLLGTYYNTYNIVTRVVFTEQVRNLDKEKKVTLRFLKLSTTH